jgi:signal transduction histidine kinase
MPGIMDIEQPEGWNPAEKENTDIPCDKDTERLQAESALREAKFHYETLRAANLALTESLDLDRVLNTLLDFLGQLVPYDSAAVLLQETGDRLVLQAFRPRDQNPDQAAKFSVVVRENRILRRILTTGQTVLIPDTRLDPEWGDHLAMRPLRSWLGVPLIAGGEVIGQYSLENTEPGAFTRIHVELAESLAAQAATAIQNARLYHSQRYQNASQAALYANALDITRSQDLLELLYTIVERATRLLGGAGGGLYLADQNRQEVRCVVSFNTEVDYSGTVLRYGEGAAGVVAETGQSLIIDDYQTWPHRAAVFEDDRPFSAILSVPLLWKDQVNGVLHVWQDAASYKFTEADKELLVQFASQASIAVENARLFGAERAAQKRAESLRKIAAALTASLDLSQVLNDILTNLERVIPYDSACVFLLDKDHLNAVAGRGFEKQEVIGKQFSLETDRLFQKIISTGLPHIIADASQEPGFIGWGNTENVRGWMGVPLRLHGRYIGLLTVDNYQEAAYSELQANLAQAFANQAAVAIENARLFEQVREGRERLQMLSQQLLNVQENERRRIALELHDQIGQTLTAVKINLQTAQRKPEAAAFEESLEQSISIVERALSQVRNLSLTLRPSMLDDLGLVAALRWYVDRQAQQGGFEIDYIADEFEKRPSSEVETACFRVAQEAMTNIMRHADATRIMVQIRKVDSELQMVIEDDGRGFEASDALERASQGKSLGLLGMRERVQLLGGKFDIETALGEGTKIKARFPLTPTEPLERRQYRRLP